MNKTTLGLCLAGCVLIVQSAALATITPKDSADFAYKYEGEATLPATAVIAPGVTYSSDGDILTYTLPSGTGGSTWIEPTAWVNAVDHSYTIETRLKVNNQSYAFGPFNIYVGGASANEGVYLFIGSYSYTYFDPTTAPGTWKQVTGADNNMDGFHTFRLTHDAGTTTVSLWRDGTLLEELPGAFGAGEAMSWLAGSGATSGSADIDYFRWTPGAYSPVPEPMTLALLGLGGLFLRKRS